MDRAVLPRFGQGQSLPRPLPKSPRSRVRYATAWAVCLCLGFVSPAAVFASHPSSTAWSLNTPAQPDGLFPACRRSLSNLADRPGPIVPFAVGPPSPTLVVCLSYALERDGTTHFGLVRRQPGAFFAKTARSLAHLADARAHRDCQMAGKWEDRIWYCRGGDIQDFRLNEPRLLQGARAAFEPGVMEVYRIASEGLSLLQFGAPAGEPAASFWNEHGVEGVGWFGQAYHGSLHSLPDGTPCQLELEVILSETQRVQQWIRYDYSFGPLAGFYPRRLTFHRISPSSGRPEPVATVRILSLSTNAHLLGQDQFDLRRPPPSSLLSAPCLPRASGTSVTMERPGQVKAPIHRPRFLPARLAGVALGFLAALALLAASFLRLIRGYRLSAPTCRFPGRGSRHLPAARAGNGSRSRSGRYRPQGFP